MSTSAAKVDRGEVRVLKNPLLSKWVYSSVLNSGIPQALMEFCIVPLAAIVAVGIAYALYAMPASASSIAHRSGISSRACVFSFSSSSRVTRSAVPVTSSP